MQCFTTFMTAIQKLLDDTLYGVRILYVDPDSAPISPLVLTAPSVPPMTARETKFEAARPQHIAFPKLPPVRAAMRTLAMDVAPQAKTAKKARGLVRRVATGIALAGLMVAGFFVVNREAELAPVMVRVVTPVLEQTQTSVADLESDQLPWNTSAAWSAPASFAHSQTGASMGVAERRVRVESFENESALAAAIPVGAAAASPATLAGAPMVVASSSASSVTVRPATTATTAAAKPVERRVAHVSMTPLAPAAAPAQQVNAKRGNATPAKPPSDLARELLADL